MARNIGERQRWAWLAAGLSAVTAACLCGYGWTWVLLGGLLVTGYYIYMDRYAPEKGVAQGLVEAFGLCGKILAVLTLLWIVLVMGWAAGLADTAFPMVDGFPSLGWVLLVLAAWGTKKGAAACARCGGVLCLFLLVLYGVEAVFALPDVEWNYLRPAGNWLEGVWTVGMFLMAAGVWYVPCTRSRKGPAWSMALLLPAFAAVLTAVTAGVLSPELAAARTVPLYDLAQSVSLFGVVERIEPLLSAAMTMGVFALLSALACAGQALADTLWPWTWSGSAVCAAAAGMMYLTRNVPPEVLTAGAVVFWFAVPVATVGVVRIRRKDE